MQNIFIALLLLAPLAGKADVNMRDAAFTKTMNEFKNPWLERNYSSRRLWSGIYGFGWCAPFERRIEVLSNGKARIFHCDREMEIQVQKAGNQIIYRGSRGAEIYDLQGRLLSIENPKAHFLYQKNGRLTEIRTREGRYRLSYHGDSPLLSLVSFGKTETQYFHEQTDLVRVLHKKSSTRLKYDNFHNLIEILEAGKTETITYQSDRDEIASYQSTSNPCNYQFSFSKISIFELRAEAERKCRGQRSSMKTFLFRSKKNLVGRLSLIEIKTSGELHDPTHLP